MSLIDSGACRPERRAFEIGIDGSAGDRAYQGAAPTIVASGRDADMDNADRALPADAYRRISFAVWSAAIVVGALSWTAFFHLV